MNSKDQISLVSIAFFILLWGGMLLGSLIKGELPHWLSSVIAFSLLFCISVVHGILVYEVRKSGFAFWSGQSTFYSAALIILTGLIFFCWVISNLITYVRPFDPNPYFFGIFALSFVVSQLKKLGALKKSL